ncbi:MAG: hypothetical protein KAI35_04325 [Desulfobulbaceae bacterium]|nr:hypothetical protein [Desulfobulbaceae bacterium]
MKIAIATDDKKSIAEHFGRSAFILVATVEDGKVVNKEERERARHPFFADDEHHPQINKKGRHGFGPKAEESHGKMFDGFKDCEVLIVNMIGIGAYNYFLSSGVMVIATDVKNIDEAVDLYINGKLNHIEIQLD